jgi:hypothetical protein
MEPYQDDPSIGEAREPPRRRRRSSLLFILGAACLIGAAIAGIRLVRSLTSLLSDVKLQIEGDPKKKIVGRGERVRLALTLGRPAAVIVYLHDPSGAIEEVYPPPGDVPLFTGKMVLPRGAADAWDTGGLDPGQYFLWTIASREPIPAGERADMAARIEKVVRGSRREEMDLYDLPRRVLDDLQPRIEEVAVRGFFIDPLHPR